MKWCWQDSAVHQSKICGQLVRYALTVRWSRFRQRLERNGIWGYLVDMNLLKIASALLCLPALAWLTSSCTTPTGFAGMSEEELLAWNKGKPVLEQVYCRKEARTSSRIRKTYCDTVEGWITYNQRSLMALETINSPTNSRFRQYD